MPVITQPMFSVILNRCVTVKVSNSLSWEKCERKTKEKFTQHTNSSNSTTMITAVESDHVLCEDTETANCLSCVCVDWLGLSFEWRPQRSPSLWSQQRSVLPGWWLWRHTLKTDGEKNKLMSTSVHWTKPPSCFAFNCTHRTWLLAVCYTMYTTMWHKGSGISASRVFFWPGLSQDNI